MSVDPLATQNQEGQFFCPQLSCGRWAIGGVGATIAVCTIVFMILGCAQPDWFARSVGTIGYPRSWPLWVITASGLIVSALLLAYASSNRKSAGEKEATTFSELLGDSLFNQIPTYSGAIPDDLQIDEASMTRSVMKAVIPPTQPEEAAIPCVILCLQCQSNEAEMKNTPALKRAHKRIIGDHIALLKQDIFVLVLMRVKNQWVQWSYVTLKGITSTPLSPSFLCQLGKGMVIYPMENLELEKQGLSHLTQLIQGDLKIISDHNGLKWKLADIPVIK